MQTPYDSRIAAQRQRIQDHSGNDSQLRDRLGQLQNRRFNYRQRNTPNQQPWNGQYETSLAQANNNLNLANNQIATQEQQVVNTYGFNNPNDPFARANMIQRNFQNAQRGTGNNYAAAGQLYAGSLSNAREIDRNNFEQSWNQAQVDQQQALDDLKSRRLGAQNDYQNAVLNAEGQRLEDSLSQPSDPAESPRNQGRGGKGKGNDNKGKNKGRH